MKDVFVFLLLLCCISTTTAAADMQYLQALGDTRYHRVESDRVGRGYHVYVKLPEGYDESSDRTYPTIYVLDGGALYPLLTAYHRYLNFGQEVPDAILVGISYGTDSFEEGNQRATDFTAKSSERDYWGGASKFQSFLSGELMPLIEKTYPARADRRIIFGQSLGGQFVLYTALTKPNLFWGHIASNPALHRNLSFFISHPTKSLPTSPQSKLFVASGTMDDPRFREPAVAWMKHWSDRSGFWQLRLHHLEGHSHMSAAPASFRQGMKWLFAD